MIVVYHRLYAEKFLAKGNELRLSAFKKNLGELADPRLPEQPNKALIKNGHGRFAGCIGIVLDANPQATLNPHPHAVARFIEERPELPGLGQPRVRVLPRMILISRQAFLEAGNISFGWFSKLNFVQ